jgi:mono/diheme cytochrome c family protein
MMTPCRRHRFWVAPGLCVASFFLLALAASSFAAEPQGDAPVHASEDRAGVEFFEKSVRPLLVARCHACHGPVKQKGDLRLDSRASALAGGDAGPAVVPGKPDESLLVDAIRYGDTYQMPPKSQLPPEEIETLVEWVRRGAPWSAEDSQQQQKPADAFDLAERAKHWCFQPLAEVGPPTVRDRAWIRTPVDCFILAKLEAAQLAPAPECDQRTLLRRVTYDLIGLPPTPAEIQCFLADESPTAYEKVVERLLASPHYGERWGRHWLDLARYAETHGHEFDFEMPAAYRYRDYIITAFNDDLPYDRLMFEHLAGDLLDPPRRNPRDGANESIVATGFFFFGEAKHSPVDVRQDEADRIDNQIDAFSKTFLALTVGCARCHDHKFDAISTADYYALAGYLQSSRYQQAFIDDALPLAGTVAGLTRLARERQRLSAELARAVLASQLGRLGDTMMAGQDSDVRDPWSKYLHETAIKQPSDVFHPWAILTCRAEQSPVELFETRRAALAGQFARERALPVASQTVFADFAQESFGDWQTTGAAFGDGPGRPATWDFTRPRGPSQGQLLEAPAAHSGLVSRKLRGTLRSPTFEISSPKIFYRLYGDGGHVRLIVDGLQLIKDPIYGQLDFPAKGAAPQWRGQDVSKWIGHRAYIELIDDGDGYLALDQVVFGDTAPPEAGPNQLVSEMLADEAIRSPSALVEQYVALLRRVFDSWSEDETVQRDRASDRAAIINWVLDRRVPPDDSLQGKIDELAARFEALDSSQARLESQLAPPRQCMAFADGTAENERVFIRGSHKLLGPEVPRRFLEVLGGKHHTPPAIGSGRRELAQQLVSPDNPLPARVMVNRIWQHHFGEGLVRTVDDFGAMGQPPTHPELLDWLAREFVRGGWSIKRMHRTMVLSNSYRMSSRGDAHSMRSDPQNALLHRMRIRRLEAESIRDAILAVTQGLDRRMFGPGVMPYLTPHMTGRGRPATSGPLDGDGRRSIYLSVRRNFLPPMFLAFDYPTPFTTIGRRGESNVPAQALAMMNNPLVIEQSRQWAARAAERTEQTPVDRIRAMYVTALGREPDADEIASGLAFVAPPAGEKDVDGRAWADLAHVLLNLKEFVFIP